MMSNLQYLVAVVLVVMLTLVNVAHTDGARGTGRSGQDGYGLGAGLSGPGQYGAVTGPGTGPSGPGQYGVICITRCCDNVTYLQYKFLNAYRDAEQDLLDQEIKKCAKEKAEANVKVFIEKEKEGQVNKASWDEISRIRDHTIQNKECKDEGKIFKTHSYIGDYFTPLQEWVHGQIQMNIIQDQAPQTNEQKQNSGQNVLQRRDISPV